ncbi:D-alanyl-D-alanine carboxypeptidase family protein [Saccharibacillus kuerlensis]|uniref:D-alanyl-D-alanine carboxypeptidase n=1 Tax=Saccharibacillus kuerlensis TaxID=459527 RepID=A0ABQ2KW85_9BACL|nr:serine hydrolase [Saccharibacillus kuerlensis]GGN95140.1 D-alanyl-D-alanine carboxypeptidase [Saccharibacillus kuerlensis]
MKNGGIWKKGTLVVLVVLLLLVPQQLLADHSKIEAAAAVLIDAQTGEILWETEGDRVLPASGIAQLMTEWLVLDAVRSGRINWEDSVRIGGEPRNDTVQLSNFYDGKGNSGIPLRSEDQIPLNELFMGLTVSSSKEAEAALARYAGSSEASFAWMMNDKARRIGMSPSTLFKPVTAGPVRDLDETSADQPLSGSRMTAKDAAALCRALIEAHPEILRMSSVAQTEISSRSIYLTNNNAMLPEFAGPHAYRGLDGLKVCGSEQDGYSFAGTAQRDGKRLIVVIMGAQSREKSFQSAGRLLDYGYARSGSIVERAASWMKLV